MQNNKKNRKKTDRLWIGLLIGLVLPVLFAFVYYTSINESGMPFLEGMKALSQNKTVMTKFAVLCILPNAVAAFTSYKLWLWDTYKGVMIVTLFSLVPIIYFLA